MLGDIRSKIEESDGVPTLYIWSEGDSDEEMNLEIPIPNLSLDHDSRINHTKWHFSGGTIGMVHDARGPDGRYIEIEIPDEQRSILIFEVPRHVLQKVERQLEYESRKPAMQARRARRETKKAKGRNLAAFRQTMGNLRPRNRNTRNPVPEAFATNSGPAALIAEFLSGKEGSTPANQARRQKRESVRSKGGRRTHRNRH